MILEPQDTALWDFTEPLKNVSKKTYSPHQPSRKDFGRTGIGGRTNTKNGPNTSGDDYLDPKKDSPFKILNELLDQELGIICSILQDRLWSYGFVTDSEHSKPVSRYLTILQANYKSLEKAADKEELVNDVTLSIFEFLGFDTDNAASKEEIKWMEQFIASLKWK